MIKKIYETKEHVVTEKVCTEAHMYCDICGKTEITGPYWKVHTFHNDWVMSILMYALQYVYNKKLMSI